MIKDLKRLLVIVVIVSTILLGISGSKAQSATKNVAFLEIEKLKITKKESISMTLHLDKITPSNFTLELSSNKAIDIVPLSLDDIEAETKSNDSIIFSIDKTNTDIDTLTFSYKVPEEVEIGDKIVLIAKVVSDGVEEEIDYEITIVEDDETEDTVNTNENKKEETSNNKNMTLISNQNKNQSLEKMNNQEKVEQVVYKGNSNNYLKSLSIKGYELEQKFSKDRNTYFVTVENETKLTLNIETESSSSTYTVTGNSNLKEGINKILITVTAKNGNIRNYRIYVVKK